MTDKELASGFKAYVPGQQSPQDADNAAASSQPNAVPDNIKLVKFRGSVLDIEKLVEKMDK